MYNVTNLTNTTQRIGKSSLGPSESGIFPTLPGEVKDLITAGIVKVTQFNDGPFAIKSSLITRPANTTAYAAGDALLDNSGAFFVFSGAVPAPGEALHIDRVRLRKSGVVLTNCQVRLNFFDALPTVTVADNAAFNAAGVLAVSSVANYVGRVDVTLDRAGVAGSIGFATAAITAVPADGVNLYAVAEVLAAYTPVSGETFEAFIEGGFVGV